MGAESAEEAAPTQSLRDAHRQALRWYRWLLVLAGNWPDDVQKPSEDDVNKRKAVAAQAKAVKRRRFVLKASETWLDFPRHPVRPHVLQSCNNILACTVCHKQSSMHSGSRSLRDLCRNICLGNVLKRCAASASLGEMRAGGGQTPLHAGIGDGHDLWRTGAMVFCKRCACHGDVKAKGLLLACSADPAKLRSKATILNRLKSGCHPRTKVFLGAPVRAAGPLLAA
jgi:hypothetical protein